ncbi:hypothetical protein GF420_00190, partial [candidate division GN15 bacterium]|nr:hypothetical protein [candidate division GN15 bacterium]
MTPATFEATRLSLGIERLLFSPQGVVNLRVGAGGGLLVWKMLDPETNTTFQVTGSKDETTDFSANELILTGLGGIDIRPLPQLQIGITGTADYLTGAGAEFASEVNDARDRWLFGGQVSFTILFGKPGPTTEWRSDEVWPTQPRADRGEPGETVIPSETRRDSDADGVPDALDKCPMTIRGVEVDRFGCGIDSDFDGVYDGLDDCPATPPEARGLVDIYGCPV